MGSIAKTDFVLQLQGLIAGLNKHYAGQTLQVDGQSTTVVSVVATFQAAVDASTTAATADTQRTAAVAKFAAARTEAAPLAVGIKAVVLAAYNSDPTTLADFALKPRKKGTVTPEVKAAAAAKAAATRKALGTKGSQQKKAAKKALADTAPMTGATAPVAAAATAAAPVTTSAKS